MEWLQKFILAYLLIINIAGFAVCGIDKKRAVRHRWRIPESRLFLVAILGGSVGLLAGMYGFRHKTKHRQFTIGIPFILLGQAALTIIMKFI